MSDVVLISTYDLGRQPFGLASPAAWLRRAGAAVDLQDLAVCSLDEQPVREALLVGIHVPMHTATRMAESVLARVRELNPRTHVCVYGLYAPMNADHLTALGADSVIGGEFEEPLTQLYRELIREGGAAGHGRAQRAVVSTARQQFVTPDRTGLPPLTQYAHLELAADRIRTVGYTEASRGCKHVCRHCPVVPVYGGRFRVVSAEVVLDDIRMQVAAGAEHITFGDPDFFNAPTHAIRIVTRLHDEFPELTYDVTIKVEHLRRQVAAVPVLARTGCVLVTSAVEAMDDDILGRLDKGHTVDDVDTALRLLRENGLTVNPTFIAFTPWTTLSGYARFLEAIATRGLVDLVSPVQYGIRLLIPAGSRVLELDDVRALVGEFDPNALAFSWANPDPAVDRLQQDVLAMVRVDQGERRGRREIFRHVWELTAEQLAERPDLDVHEAPELIDYSPIAYGPRMTEPWYCCAEPTDEQLAKL